MYRWWLKYGTYEDVDVVVNGDFATNTVWQKDNGWTIAAGIASCDGDNELASIAQAAILTAGEYYTLDFDLIVVGGGIYIADDAGGIPFGLDYTTTQHVTFSFVPPAGGYLVLAGFNNFEGSIDNVVCTHAVEVESRVYPSYAKAQKHYAKEQNEELFRESLKGKLNFTGTYYGYIMNAAFDQRMELRVEFWNGVAWLPYWNGFFYRADGDVNEEIESFVVEVTPDDDYEIVLNGMEKEFNVVDLAPVTETIAYSRQPVHQFYIQGESFITNVNGGISWEEEVSPETSVLVLQNDYKFDWIAWGYIAGTGAFAGASGLYNFIGGDAYEHIDGGWFLWTDYVDYFLSTTNGGTKLAKLVLVVSPFDNPAWDWEILVGTGTVDSGEFSLFARILTGKSTILSGSVATVARPTTDLLEWSGPYDRVAAYSSGGFGVGATNNSLPTPYGVIPASYPDAGNYYLKPVGVDLAIPIARNIWDNYSFWFLPDSDTLSIDENDGEADTIRDCYPLYSVISKLLNAIGSDVTHENTQTYSTWLYSSRDVGMHKPDLYITPKSNLIHTNYEQAASRAMLTLGNVIEMLHNVYRAYWYINDGKFVVEHIKFFQNGNRYSAPILQIDLSTILHPRTGKYWNFGTNKYKYDKLAMPERIEYGWMDQGSIYFDGYPIQMNSNYVQGGKVEKRVSTRFTSDINLVMISPGRVEEDGFLLLDCLSNTVQFADVVVGGETYVLQNGYCSFVFLHPEYHIYDLPTTDVTMNGLAYTASYTRSLFKVSDVAFPMSITSIDPSPYKLIRTDVGDGKIRELDVELNNRFVTTTLEYDTE